MGKTRPEIELYMYSLNQEFPVSKGHSVFLKRDSDAYRNIIDTVDRPQDINRKTLYDTDWVHDWCNFGPDWEKWCQIEGLGHELGDPLQNTIVRQEEFGSIIFDRFNDRLYKTNVPGYRLFQEILVANKNNKLVDFHSTHFKSQDTGQFINFLKGAGLWPAMKSL